MTPTEATPTAKPLQGFAPVAIAPPAPAPSDEPPAGAASAGAPAASVPAIEIDLPCGGHVRIIGAVEAKLAAAVLAALVKR